MQIKILQLIEGAKVARGLTVVIDVFRAFSLECYLFSQGAKEIIAVGDIQLAYQLKENNRDFILIGERNERIPEGFDYGNSPTHILNVDFSNKTIIHTTSAGTQGLVNATNATEIITGSFINAEAIVNYIKKQNPENVSLVCMGYSTLRPSEEDTFCAEYIMNSLQGKKSNFSEMLETIKKTSGQRLFDKANQAHSPESDFYLCTDLNKFNFVIKATSIANNSIKLEKIWV